MTRVDALCLLSTGHLLRILIPLEEPPHLTADQRLFYLHNKICPSRTEFGHGNPVGFPSHCEALAEQWGEFMVSRRAREGTLVIQKDLEKLRTSAYYLR